MIKEIMYRATEKSEEIYQLLKNFEFAKIYESWRGVQRHYPIYIPRKSLLAEKVNY